MSVFIQYEAAIARGEIADSPSQRAILGFFQDLLDEKSQTSWFARKQKTPLKGIYLYGSVGVGKTYLMDLFYQELKRKKVRLHFHQFMQQVDARLRALQGQKNPLRRIAKEWSKEAQVLCLDELLIHDVAHALILAELLPALIQCGLTVVFTSNTAPDALYLHGMGRARFLPTIALIKQHCRVVHLNESKDYRQEYRPCLQTYLYPKNQENQHIMEKQFRESFEHIQENGWISIQGRDISYLKCAKNAIWFDFNQICNLPRSQLDYLEIAHRFETVFLSTLPLLIEKYATQTLLFIHLVDVLYDCGVKLIILAQVPVEDLYKEGNLQEAFKRTQSRLIEMQSKEYQLRPLRKNLLKHSFPS